jgi:hypothetical protein
METKPLELVGFFPLRHCRARLNSRCRIRSDVDADADADADADVFAYLIIAVRVVFLPSKMDHS